MDLEKVLEVANECVENDRIPVEGLTLLYKLSADTHKKLDEELFYKTNNNIGEFNHNEVIEINLAGITFMFEII